MKKMTLARQLIIAVSLIFLAVLIGVQAVYLRSARAHLQNQLESHAQDAATSLGLSLGIMLGSRRDYAIAETIIKASFDRGQYERIELVTLDKEEPVVSRRLEHQREADYPAWFERLFPLTGPTAESLVSTGWQQLGRVRVTSHPRFAYEQLWGVARDTALLMALIYGVAMLVLRAFLGGILRPLGAVARAAEAISRRDFVTVDSKPGTRELARVVEAMNLLSSRVRSALEAETARAAKLQEAAYMDAVSGLLNRRGLRTRFDGLVDEAHSFSGAVCLLQITNLQQVNEAQGPERGDEAVRAVARIMAECVAQRAGAGGLAGRWGGALFALIVPDQDEAAVRTLLEDVQKQAEAALAALLVGGMAGGDLAVSIAIGAVFVARGRPLLKELVEAANEALQQAAERNTGLPALRVLDAAQAAQSMWTEERIDVVRQAISLGRVALVSQRVLAVNGHGAATVLHHEIMGRLLDGAGGQLSAVEFMPLVSRHKLSVEFDQAIVRKVLDEVRSMREGGQAATLAINLAAPSAADPAFCQWLSGELRGAPGRTRGRGGLTQLHLIFELSEHGVLQDEAAALRFADHVRNLGAAFAIDHFGVHRDSLALVQRLRPAYVKLSAVHTPRIVSNTGTRFFIESLVRAGQQLDVPVIAQGVEDEATLSQLKALGLQGYQGYVAGRPADWP